MAPAHLSSSLLHSFTICMKLNDMKFLVTDHFQFIKIGVCTAQPNITINYIDTLYLYVSMHHFFCFHVSPDTLLSSPLPYINISQANFCTNYQYLMWLSTHQKMPILLFELQYKYSLSIILFLLSPSKYYNFAYSGYIRTLPSNEN